jgi:hypothetical protein
MLYFTILNNFVNMRVVVVVIQADLKKIWERYKITETHPEFPSIFLKSVQFYNSFHL